MESRGCPRLKGKPRPSESSRPIRSAISISILPRFEGKLYLLVAIDRTSKFAFVELRETVSRRDAADFLRRLIGAVPYKGHTVLPDNGTHFTDPAGDSWSPVEIREMIADRRVEALPSAC